LYLTGGRGTGEEKTEGRKGAGKGKRSWEGREGEGRRTGRAKTDGWIELVW